MTMIEEPEDAVAPENETGDADIDQRYMVPGLSRGLSLLHLFDKEHRDQSLADISENSGLSRSAAFRLVYTLEKEGYLRRDPVSRRYTLTAKVLSLGFSYLTSQPLTEIIHPHLKRLSLATRASAHLIQLDGMYAVYLARAVAPVALVSNLQVGTRLPAYATASGRVLLAGLDEAVLASIYWHTRREQRGAMPPLLEIIARARQDRERGYVMGESIFDPGVLSFAAPIRDGTGATVAAINVMGFRGILESVGDEAVLREIVGAEVAAISELLGYKAR